MGNINGIVITVKAPDESGAMTQLEKPVFATARRHPKLLECIKKIASASIHEDAAGRRSALAAEALAAAPAEKIDECRDAALKAADAAQDATLAVATAAHAFVVEGFIGAGYTEEQAERYAALVAPERIPELKARCMLGAGYVDFSRGS